MQQKLLPVISFEMTFGPLNGLCMVFVKFERANHFAVLFVRYVEIKNNRRNADPKTEISELISLPGGSAV